MDYLEKGYGWSFDPEQAENHQLKVQPLHPFSAENFRGDNASFDTRWHALSQPTQARQNVIELDPPEQALETMTLEALVRFFDHPPRSFAQTRLALTLGEENTRIDDTEPFDAGGLEAYLEREKLLVAALDHHPEAAISQARHRATISGRLPNSRLTVDRLDTWEEEAREMADHIRQAGGDEIQREAINLNINGIMLSGELPWVQGQNRLLLWRPSKMKPKDEIRLWLYHLCAQCQRGEGQQTQGIFLDNAPLLTATTAPASQLENLLQVYQKGLCTPLPLHAELGLSVCKAQYTFPKNKPPALKSNPVAAQQKKWDQLWHPEDFSGGFGIANDPYTQWFWPEAPELRDWSSLLESVYQPATTCLIGGQDEEK